MTQDQHKIIEFAVSDTPVDYAFAHEVMEKRVKAISERNARELIWFLEHPPLYTAGTSANPSDLKQPDRFEVFQSGRGGEYTYHGPGQRVAYVMMDLTQRGRDVRQFVRDLEQWLIDALAKFNVVGERRCERVGVWVNRTEPGGLEREDKIAAIGIRLRRWVSFHGIALNVEPDLSHFKGITPCGIADPRYGVTSLVDLGLPITIEDADLALKSSAEAIFGRLEPVAAPVPGRN